MKLTLIEMNGLLNGKCLPSDLIVGETLAEYLVRKFADLEQKLAESKREFRAADATIENLQMQVEKLAAENAGLTAHLLELFNSCDTGERRGNGSLSGAAVPDWSVLEKTRQFLESTPATDAFLAEVRASGVDMFAAHKRERQQALRSRSMRMSEEAAGMAADAEDFADQIRKGVQS